jgi:hypothetical protein
MALFYQGNRDIRVLAAKVSTFVLLIAGKKQSFQRTYLF